MKERVLHGVRALVLAWLIWGQLVTCSFGVWSVYTQDCCSPVDVPYAVSEYQGYVRFGWLTQEEADRRIAEARQQYLAWAWGEVQWPLALSAVAVPVFTSLILRRPKRHRGHPDTFKN